MPAFGNAIDPGEDQVSAYLVHWGDGTAEAGPPEQDRVAISDSDLDNMPPWLQPFLLNLPDANGFDGPNNNIAVILRKEDGS